MKIELNNEKNGIEISFNKKPDQNIRANLRFFGFKWHNVKKLWYAKQTMERLEFSDSLK